MKLALLGVDASLLALAAAPPDGQQVVGATELTPADQAQLERAAPAIPRTDTWEGLLAGEVDAVVVARGGDSTARVAQVRRLAAEGVPLLIAHPLSSSSLDLYEIELAQRDGDAALVPWLPARKHPAIARVAELLADAGPLGTVEQIVFERALVDRGAEGVWTWLAQDIDLLRAICGELNRALATGPREKGEPTVAHLTAHFGGPEGPPVRWSLEPARGVVEGRLILVGAREQAVLHMPEQGPWRLEVAAEAPQTFEDWSPARAAIDTLSAAQAGEPGSPTWTDAVRSVELVEAVERSLRRGRQVELRWDDNTEASNFKSTMTAVGCGLLLFGLVAIVAAAVGQKVAEKLGFLWLAARLGEWPWWLLGLLVSFLSLQALRLVIADKVAPPAAETPLEEQERLEGEDF